MRFRTSAELTQKSLAKTLLLASFVFFAKPGYAQEPPLNASQEAQVSGPPIWQLRHGDNVLWMVGQIAPAPESLRWNEAFLQQIIAESEEFIGQHVAMPSEPGFFKKIPIQRKQEAMLKIPDNQTLSDILSAELYAEFLAAKQQYAPDHKNIEKMRPMFAAIVLIEAALQQHGYGFQSNFNRSIREAVRKQNIPVTQYQTRFAVEDLVDTMTNDITMELELSCLEKVLYSIENELPNRDAYVKAWENGDIDALREIEWSGPKGYCRTSAHMLDEGFRKADEQAHQQWLDAVVSALENNSVSFTVVPTRGMLDDNGRFPDLKELGYEVREYYQR